MATPVLRPSARPRDEAGILAVVADAFSDAIRDASEELDIVRATWGAMEDTEVIELVAEDEGMVVAHALAAPGRVDGAPSSVAGVAPVCVAPTHQQRGIGTALVQALIDEASSRGWPLLLLLGDPAYYSRVGFEPAAPLGFTYKPAAGSPAFQARRLAQYDARVRGTFTYCWE